MAGKHKLAFLIGGVVAVTASCTGDGGRSQQYPMIAAGATLTWDSVFRGQEVPFSFRSDERPVQRLGRVFLSPTSEIIVPDVRASRLLVLDSVGVRVREMSLPQPASPAEFPSTLVVDDSLFVHLYIPAKRKILVYNLKSHQKLREVTVEGLVTDLAPAREGGYYVYYPANVGGSVRLIDRDGHTTRSVLPISSDRLREFHGRTQNGGIAALADTAIIAVEPEHYAVHRLTPSLRSTTSYYGDTTSAFSFNAKPLPDSLSPTDLTKAHTRWWDTFRHPDRPFALGDSLLLVSHYASKGLWKSAFQVSILTPSGRVIADGLDVPFEGRVVGVRGNTVIVGVPPKLVGNTDSLSALRLFRYTFQWPK